MLTPESLCRRGKLALQELPHSYFPDETWPADLHDALYTNFLDEPNDDPDHLEYLDSLLTTAGEDKPEPEKVVPPPKVVDVKTFFEEGPTKILSDSLGLKLLRLLARERPKMKIIINGVNNANGQISPSYQTPVETLEYWLTTASSKNKKQRKFLVISKAGDSFRIGFLRKNQIAEIRDQASDPAFQPLLRWTSDESVMDFLFNAAKAALPPAESPTAFENMTLDVMNNKSGTDLGAAAPFVAALNETALSIARWACRDCGWVALREAARSTQIFKADGSLSCVGNDVSARIVTTSLLTAFPNHHIVIDEEIEDPVLRELNGKNAESPYQWHVTSLQGTREYLGTGTTWSFQMVLLYKGVPIVAVVLFPEQKQENPNGLLLNTRLGQTGVNVGGKLLTHASVWNFIEPFLMAAIKPAFEFGSASTPSMQIKIPSPNEFYLRIAQA